MSADFQDLTMEKPQNKAKRWKPDKPISIGAAAYHDAVSNVAYYIENLDELADMVSKKFKDGEVVVDFGAGTGVSALRLVKKLNAKIKLVLVDNSASWLRKAYEIFISNPYVECFLLEKINERYATLAETIGRNAADHVICANTMHLIPDIKEAFIGINEALKQKGTFTFQSGNIKRGDREKGVLMIDDTIKRVHDIALDIVRNDKKFVKYAKDLDKRIEIEDTQRKFVFPDPRPIDYYLKMLESAGFVYEKPHYKLIRIAYRDWLNFLRVKRLQAGILPEVGGKNPSPEEEHDRDELITMASNKLFKELEANNPMANDKYFTVEWIYVAAKKKSILFPWLLEGKNALITGSSRGIGRAIAVELAKNGANVIINYHNSEKEAMEVLDKIKDSGVKFTALKADVSNHGEVKAMFDIIKKEFGTLDIVINNAGIIIDKTLQNMGKREWDDVIKVNLTGVFNVTHNALKLLNKNGRIINISSIVALDGNFGQTNYAASKAGIIGFTKSLAKEVGKSGITVNAVAPGLIETDIIKGIPISRRKEIDSIIPLGRIGKPEDVAKVVAFLASDKAGYITGEVISVNGGLRF